MARPTEKKSPAVDGHTAQYATSLDAVPVTHERQPYRPKANRSNSSTQLEDAGTARANIAASAEAPAGTTADNWAARYAQRSVLQQHCRYWDADDDGVIWPQDTFRGVRAWGWPLPLCLFATWVINAGLSYPTCPGLLPDPCCRIYLANIHKDKHGSDSNSFDPEGRFRPQSFEDIFAKYDRGDKGGLDMQDLFRMLKGQRLIFDFFGWLAATLEWLAVYLLLWPEDGVMRKEDIRRVFDGSIFQHKADEYARKREQDKVRRRLF